MLQPVLVLSKKVFPIEFALSLSLNTTRIDFQWFRIISNGFFNGFEWFWISHSHLLLSLLPQLNSSIYWKWIIVFWFRAFFVRKQSTNQQEQKIINSLILSILFSLFFKSGCDHFEMDFSLTASCYCFWSDQVSRGGLKINIF